MRQLVLVCSFLRCRAVRRRISRYVSGPEGGSGPLDVADRYSSFDWWQHLMDLPYSRILRLISLQLAFNSVLALMVYASHRYANWPLEPLPVTPLITCSAALGLLLVFRTTAAYERWQLGQRHAYELRHNLQQILRICKTWLSPSDFRDFQAKVRTFPVIIAKHLTAKAGAGFLYGVGPRDLLSEISEKLYQLTKDPATSTATLYALDRVQGSITESLRLVTDMERLASEAVPRDYSRHTSRFLTAWMFYLPFVLLDCGDFMPVAVTIICWALLSCEEIGHTLEDPFNSPTQPVALLSILVTGGGENTLALSYKVVPESPEVLKQGDELWERKPALPGEDIAAKAAAAVDSVFQVATGGAPKNGG